MIARNACSPSREIAAHHQRNAQGREFCVALVYQCDILSHLKFKPAGRLFEGCHLGRNDQPSGELFGSLPFPWDG
jgi:hypothetical protein